MAEADGDGAALLAEAWRHCYLTPPLEADFGRRLAALAGPTAPWGWWHVAMAEVRVGSADDATAALEHARAAFEAAGDARGLNLCDEVLAIRLRRDGDPAASRRLQDSIDLRPDPGHTALDRFIGHNSRAITCKLLGQVDDALRHFHAAYDAAESSGDAGARITALSNLGGYQQELFNLDDAREMCERAFQAARDARSPRNVASSANNLISIYYSLGEALRARAMADIFLQHSDELPANFMHRHRSAVALAHVAVGEFDQAEAVMAGGDDRELVDGDGAMLWAWLGMRCALARGEPARARALAEAALGSRAGGNGGSGGDGPFDLMELHRALADACEQLGDPVGALHCVRQAQALYEQLVGRSARARRVALQVGFDLARAQRERDIAVDSQRAAEADRQRLAELNAALERQVAENESLQGQLREQALRDPLTGLHNRRYLFEAAPSQLEMARRNGQPLTVVLLDLDHFKLLNDTYGHQAGDMVLQRFGTLMADTLRRSDIVCRHGGEEFVAVMPAVEAEAAQAVLARLLEQYQALPLELGRRRLPRCTFSAGIAVFPRHGSTLEQLLSRADRALYRAKQQGRSRIEQVPGSTFSALA